MCRPYRRSWDRSEKVGTTIDISGFPKHGHAHNTDVMSPTGLSIGQENSDTVSNTAGNAISKYWFSENEIQEHLRSSLKYC